MSKAQQSAAMTEDVSAARARMLGRFDEVRAQTMRLVRPLSAEDMGAQSMTDASPAKWHLAHTTWFFETFVLERFDAGHEPIHPAFRVLFNSYYKSVGAQFPRSRRGLLTRPGVDEVLAYRRETDERVRGLLERADAGVLSEMLPIMEIGLQHEQQHQELLLTDVKHLLWCNPLRPAYEWRAHDDSAAAPEMRFVEFEGGVVEIGHTGEGFGFDNEFGRHRVFLEPFALADRLLSNEAVMAFVEDGGYERPELWLDKGWSTVQGEGWTMPLYWRREGSAWLEFTLSGERSVDPHEPATHVSLFEADAIARWMGCRLATEFEWEHACAPMPVWGNFVEDGLLHPLVASDDPEMPIRQAYGDCWEWTGSQYRAYPGYRVPEGALGEYNGKFMCDQFVLRGGSCATARSHIRASYRNFFHPAARWQFAGVRLAKDLRG